METLPTAKNESLKVTDGVILLSYPNPCPSLTPLKFIVGFSVSTVKFNFLETALLPASSVAVTVILYSPVSEKHLVATAFAELFFHGKDSVVVLPASIESRKIIEAFVRWSEVGGKSWNFEGSTDYLFRVQKWTESIKPIIVKSIMRYEETENREVDD